MSNKCYLFGEPIWYLFACIYAICILPQCIPIARKILLINMWFRPTKKHYLVLLSWIIETRKTTPKHCFSITSCSRSTQVFTRLQMYLESWPLRTFHASLKCTLCFKINRVHTTYRRLATAWKQYVNGYIKALRWEIKFISINFINAWSEPNTYWTLNWYNMQRLSSRKLTSVEIQQLKLFLAIFFLFHLIFVRFIAVESMPLFRRCIPSDLW